MQNKIKLADLKVQSFITGQQELGGLKAARAIYARDTEQTECYHCDSAGQGCSAPCN